MDFVNAAESIDYRAIHRVADRARPRYAGMMTSAIRKAKREVSLDTLTRMVNQGDLEGMRQHTTKAVNVMDRRLHEEFVPLLLGTLVQGANAAQRIANTKGTFLVTAARSTSKFTVSFDESNPFAAQWAREHAAKRIVDISATTRAAVRAAIDEAFMFGLSPRDTAKTIQHLVGLTEPQTRALLKKQAKMIADGSRKAETVSWLRRETERRVKKRALLIARTETIEAASEGQRQLWREAQRQGQLGDDVERVWIITPDDRLCPICRGYEGLTAPIEGVFANGVSNPPAHAGCRCAQGLQTIARRVAA